MVPSGKMGLGQPPEPESKPLRLMINLLGCNVALWRSNARQSSAAARRHPVMVGFVEGTVSAVYGSRARSTAFLVLAVALAPFGAALRAIPS